jgi:orotidine-5'-phosphate decarboxylase
VERLPDCLKGAPDAIFQFNRAIIDATAAYACAFKPQFAHYAAADALGQLRDTIRHIHDHHPGVPVILDSKRGDIGSTAAKYAEEAFGVYGADAVTVNPYLGTDGIGPFLSYADKGVVILCRTSNPSARELQDLEVAPGERLYHRVARLAVERWNANGNAMLVVGATYPAELGEIRAIVGDMPLLVPGIGAQGGDVAAAVSNGRDSRGAGMAINSSRGIIHAGGGADFAAAAGTAARVLRDEINLHRR